MALIEQVKRKLNITWSDEDTDKRVDDIIASANPIMRRKLGIADAAFDFSLPGEENDLFKSYCLYEWNHAANEFDENYAIEIAQCRAVHEVKHFEETESEADAEST